MRFANTYPSPNITSSGIAAFLEWVRMWYYCWTERTAQYEYIYETPNAYPRYTRNRERRRFEHKELPAEQHLGFYYCILPKDLSPTQFQERVSRLTIYGRRRFYYIRHWRNLSVPRLKCRVLGYRMSRKALCHKSGYRGYVSGGIQSVPLSPD